jgi:hypothetical protein
MNPGSIIPRTRSWEANVTGHVVKRIRLGRTAAVRPRRPLEHLGTTMRPLAQLRVPRWLGIFDRSRSQVHVFCDESERVYGAALYVRYCTADRNLIQLTYSKSRLAR